MFPAVCWHCYTPLSIWVSYLFFLFCLYSRIRSGSVSWYLRYHWTGFRRQHRDQPVTGRCLKADGQCHLTIAEPWYCIGWWNAGAPPGGKFYWIKSKQGFLKPALPSCYIACFELSFHTSFFGSVCALYVLYVCWIIECLSTVSVSVCSLKMLPFIFEDLYGFKPFDKYCTDYRTCLSLLVLLLLHF